MEHVLHRAQLKREDIISKTLTDQSNHSMCATVAANKNMSYYRSASQNSKPSLYVWVAACERLRQGLNFQTAHYNSMNKRDVCQPILDCGKPCLQRAHGTKCSHRLR